MPGSPEIVAAFGEFGPRNAWCTCKDCSSERRNSFPSFQFNRRSHAQKISIAETVSRYTYQRTVSLPGITSYVSDIF